MYDQYLPTTGWHSVEEETAGGEEGFGGLLGSLLSRFGMGGGSAPAAKDALFPGIPLLEKLDSGDILLLLVLYCLYQESKDEEWLIILGLVLLMW